MKRAFTLAETLITLGIIGIIAALTIPSLFTKYSQERTVIQLKKTYANLQQAVRMASEDYGDCEGWDYTLEQADFINKYFSPYIKLSPITLKSVYKYNDLAGKPYTINKNTFILIDGTIIYFYRYKAFQNKNFLLVDLNGNSKPNRLGRDVFVFSFYQNILTGYSQYTANANNWLKNAGYPGTSGQCNKNASGGAFGPGSYCSTFIMYNNWTIPVGYPWK